MCLLSPASNRPIILIGYRGTGKTTVARKLANRLGCSAIDSDSEIENKAGMTITEIFKQHGEKAFRDLESQVVADILLGKYHDHPVLAMDDLPTASSSTPPAYFVLATGGGAILRPDTRQRLRDAGHVIWLTANPETILRRIQSDIRSLATRPSLTPLPALEEIIALLQVRTPLYCETAHDIVATDCSSVEEIVETILERFHY